MVPDANAACEYDRYGTFPQNTDRTRSGELPFSTQNAVITANVSQYYKPWQSRPGDEAVIKEQIEEAEATIAREVAEFEAKYPPEAFAPEQPPLDGTQKEAEQEEKPKPEQQEQTDTKPDQPAPQPQADPTDSEPKEEAQNVPEPVGIETNDGASDPIKTGGMSTNAEESVHDQNEAHRDDDGGEVVEDNEDTVIY